ncbi:hypothetical protein RRG08_036287 [Elysia crispata]|uniref:Uncharacterized protein n=1 Tax=Elysia crispata TaxID=231223 RepID=A0AAE0ZTE0_9GAST|nr:hypothetical protein RRG08_036287 [Elysia crispata]
MGEKLDTYDKRNWRHGQEIGYMLHKTLDIWARNWIHTTKETGYMGKKNWMQATKETEYKGEKLDASGKRNWLHETRQMQG